LIDTWKGALPLFLAGKTPKYIIFALLSTLDVQICVCKQGCFFQRGRCFLMGWGLMVALILNPGGLQKGRD